MPLHPRRFCPPPTCAKPGPAIWIRTLLWGDTFGWGTYQSPYEVRTYSAASSTSPKPRRQLRDIGREASR